jgi:hypothetical protein
MKIRNVVTAAMLSGMLFAVPAVAQNQGGFSALQGVESTELSAQEMDAITGQVNAAEIAAALDAKAAALAAAGFPKLSAAATRLAQFYRDNAGKIDALFMKLGVYTP